MLKRHLFMFSFVFIQVNYLLTVILLLNMVAPELKCRLLALRPKSLCNKNLRHLVHISGCCVPAGILDKIIFFCVQLLHLYFSC